MNLTNFKKIYLQEAKKVKGWAESRLFGLFILNLTIMVLVLLRSAGYFSPFFLITINFIVFVALVLSVILLGFKTKGVFMVALFLWLFTGFLRIINIQVWAERAAVYMFQALIVGVVVLIIETIRSK